MSLLEIPGLAAHAAQQGGLFTTGQALDAGVSHREISARTRRGEWSRLRRGVLAPTELVEQADDIGTHLLHARAAQLTLQSPVAFSHVTAAAAHGLPLFAVGLADVHVTHLGPGSSARVASGVQHHVGALTADRVGSASGLPVTDLARTAFDVARTEAPEVALCVADAACARGVSAEQLRAELVDRADWPGSIGASRVLPRADPRSESAGESRARWAFHLVDLAPDELQLELSVEGAVVRVDFAWTGWGVVAEFDGRVKYGRLVGPGQQPSDVAWRERQRELAIERAGWVVVRFTWAELFDLDLVRSRLLEARSRARALRAAGNFPRVASASR